MSNSKPWQFVEFDDNGVPTVHVEEKNLSDFPKFMHFIINYKIGMSEGVFKVKLVGAWESQSKLEDLLHFARKYFATEVQTGKTKKLPQLQRQSFFYGMANEHLYGFKGKQERNASERLLEKEFLKNLESPSSFSCDQCTCCLDSLSISKENLLNHYWSIVRNNSVPSCGIKEMEIDSMDLNESQVNCARKKYYISNEDCSQQSLVSMELPADSVASCETILYSPGIPVLGRDFPITPTFSLSKLGTVLDIYPEIVPGISYPFMYIGTKHASFPWHVENVCTFSINYLHFGAPCVWFLVPPKYYKKFIHWCQHMPLDIGHTSCTNILGHKYLIAGGDLLGKLGIPVLTVVQKEKEIVVTYPFAAHSGFKTGYNISEAANFGDPWWVELAILAPTCECFKFQLRMNLKQIIAVCRPHLLQFYVRQDMLGLFNALERNEFISELGILPQKLEMSASLKQEPFGIEEPKIAPQDNFVGEEEEQNKSEEFKFKGSRCLLECCGCDKTFTGGRAKLYRIKKHIKANHNGDYEVLWNKVQSMYPHKPAGKIGSKCLVCGEWRSGNKFHMQMHMDRKHAVKKN